MKTSEISQNRNVYLFESATGRENTKESTEKRKVLENIPGMKITISQEGLAACEEAAKNRQGNVGAMTGWEGIEAYERVTNTKEICFEHMKEFGEAMRQVELHMRKNLLAALLTITLFFVVAASNSIISEASELSEITDSSENQVEFTDITLESVDIAELPVISYNNVDRPYTGETIVVDGISTHSGSNDNPNSALLFENNLGDSQSLTAANEQRWYAMILSEKTKVSVYMSMDAAMDADLYVFSLDNSAGTLNLIGGRYLFYLCHKLCRSRYL